MPKLPLPPAPVELAARVAPEWYVLTAGTLVWRLYFQGGPFPAAWNTFRAFGPVRDGRFDHHQPPIPPSLNRDRAILYGAALGITCLAEVFQDTRMIDRSRRQPWLVAFDLRSDLRLVDLRGSWTTRAGASMKISTGPRPVAQAWSRSVYDAYPLAEGLAYSSCMHANEPAYAIYERGQAALPDPSGIRFHRALTDRALVPLLDQASAELGYGVV